MEQYSVFSVPIYQDPSACQACCKLGNVITSPNFRQQVLDYFAIVGTRPPPSLTPDTFLKGCEVLVEVKTVKHLIVGNKKILADEIVWYSKINRLIKLTAGTPPCMRAKK